MNKLRSIRLKLAARRGIALPFALISIIIITSVSMGVFYESSQEFQVGRNSLSQQRAMAAAELGQSVVMGTWNKTLGFNLATGDTLLRDSSSSEGWSYHTVTTKLNSYTFWLMSEGKSNIGSALEARHRTGMLLRTILPQISVLGGLTTAGAVRVAGSSMVNGNNANPSLWVCPTLSANMPGIVTGNSGTNAVQIQGSATVSGNPASQYSDAANDSATYFIYQNDITWQTITGMASIVYPATVTITSILPSVTNGACNTALSSNWGDPIRHSPAAACESHFPIIYVKGDAMVASSGYGQGILLVEGDLDLSGGFYFYGIIIARGKVTSSGTGAHVTGAVMARDADLDRNTVVGNSEVQYSGCAIDYALKGAASVKPLRDRAWTEVFY
jgi:hypothetical protein